VAGPKTWITVTVTAADGTVSDEYHIEITVGAAMRPGMYFPIIPFLRYEMGVITPGRRR
jgi:hypothetical protein